MFRVSSATVTAKPVLEEDFEIINEIEVQPLPFFRVPVPVETPMGLVQAAVSLGSAKVGLREMTGPERVRYAYAAGREAAAQLRGDPSRVSAYRIADRSPSYYVVLQGCDPAATYRLVVTTFSDFKTHAFQDSERARPTNRAPGSVDRAFYSRIEARAYCKGAGLVDLP